ncbi:LCP family protein [Nesterenkonia alba]|uniref:LCP family protein n=1 Tax=Nesterenkonia alba TaxID=515814 RepID=UPI0003B377BE|nr:LCP family protein [Nesterenkonia alba]
MTVPSITYHEFSGQRDVVRNPRGASAAERTRRAGILTTLTLVVPGGAQVTAGSRALGRAALSVTVACWALLLLGLIMAFTMRGPLLTALTQPFVMWLGTVLLGALAIGWLILWLDTARLVKFATLAPGARAVIGVALVVLMTLTSGGLGYAAKMLHDSRIALAGIFDGGTAIPAEEGRYNFLLMGADGEEGRDQGVRPDSIHVISVNQQTAETIIFSIPRNFQNAQFREDSPLWEVYPSGYDCGNECIINFLYTDVHNHYSHLYPDARDPGAEAMMDAVSGTLDLSVHGYVMVDMDGFSELIDAMGGVTIESGGYVPYRGHRPDGSWGDVWWEPGEYTFDGDEALAYARSREFSSDYNRIQRQQCIQQAMIGQFNPQMLLTRFTEVMQAGESMVETNLAQSQLGRLLDLAAKAQEHTPQRLTLGAPDFGSQGDLFSTYPDFEQIHSRVDELIAAEEGSADQSPDADEAAGEAEETADDAGADQTEDSSPPGPTPEHTDEAVAGDEPGHDPEETALPTQPDGSPLTAEYLMQAQDRGEVQILEQAASTNGECEPAG